MSLAGIFLGGLALALLLSQAASQCTLPSDLRGAWLRGRDAKTLTFSSSGVTGLGVSGSGDSFDSFDCHLQSGSTYVLRSTSTTTSNGGNYLYMCLELHQVNTNSFYAYEKAAENAEFGSERVVKLPVSTTVSSVGTACTLPASSVPFFSLLRAGSETAAKQTCPGAMQGRYNYTYEMDTCAAESLLDVSTDTASPTFDYTLCPVFMLGSRSGILHCVGAVTSGSITFVLLYNTDPVSHIDNFLTFRFTCVAVATSTASASRQMSHRPNACLPSMTPATAPSGGGVFSLSLLEEPTTTTTTTTAALNSTESSESSTTLGAALGGVFGALVLTSLVAMAAAAVAAGLAMALGVVVVLAIFIASDKISYSTAGPGATAGLPYTFSALSASYRPSASPLLSFTPLPKQHVFKDHIGIHERPSISSIYKTRLLDAPVQEGPQGDVGEKTLPPLRIHHHIVHHHHAAHLPQESKGANGLLAGNSNHLPNSAANHLPNSDFLPNSAAAGHASHEYVVMEPVPRNPYQSV